MNISSATAASSVQRAAPPPPPPPSSSAGKPDADGDHDGSKAASGGSKRLLDVTA